MVFSCVYFLPLLLLLSAMAIATFGYGSSGPIAAAFGDNGFFCAIDAGGKQEVICWQKNNNKSSLLTSPYASSLPAMVSLSGGEGFLCGISMNTSQAFCWTFSNSGIDHVSPSLKDNSYSQIAAGMNHVCAIRGSYVSSIGYGIVDCWGFYQTSNGHDVATVPVYNSSFNDPNNALFNEIVSGDGFSCGVSKNGSVICWGPKSDDLGYSAVFGSMKALISDRDSVCGISGISGEVKCLGNGKELGGPVNDTHFVSLSAGAHHFCGIREDDHGIECWGSINASSVPKGSGFTAIASSDYTTCGVREADLVLDCWDVHGQSPPDYCPPLQLCSPGVCSPGSCATGEFVFNASILNEPELTSLCVQRDLKICLPCGSNCSDGFFPSSLCSENADRICTACSLCQNSSCWDTCGHPSSSEYRLQEQREMKKLVIIIGACVSALMLVLIGWCLAPPLFVTSNAERDRSYFTSCLSKQVVEAEPDPDLQVSVSMAPCVGTAQVFRLSELKDATSGFKEFNELGRGSYGFVYKATLADGSHVAVKRANAATIIHTNSREFEAELDILCNVRHSNIVNLLGYCAEMGERLLVYEFMPHGTLHDHLHGELSPLDWNLRLKISAQAARGIEYLHKVASPQIVHGDVKTSNIFLDANWEARVADFGILSASNTESNRDIENDVYSFGIVLLEILSGRKAYDRDYAPPSIVEWALPSIKRGRAAAILDTNLTLPRNVEPLLKLAEVAELALREDPLEHPVMSDVVLRLNQIAMSGSTI